LSDVTCSSGLLYLQRRKRESTTNAAVTVARAFAFLSPVARIESRSHLLSADSWRNSMASPSSTVFSNESSGKAIGLLQLCPRRIERAFDNIAFFADQGFYALRWPTPIPQEE